VRIRTGWTALAVAVLVFALGWWQKQPCRSAGWPYLRELMFGRRCYSDLPVLYDARGLAEGVFPYSRQFEYPVLTGLVADVTARLNRLFDGDVRAYVEINTLLLLGCLLLVVWATGATFGKPRDGLMVALAPTVALAGLINWDLLAVAATSGALLAWARKRPALAGVLLGLGTAAKLYPALILGPMVLLALRERRAGPALRAVGGAVAAWLAVNLPVALAEPAGWAYFWRFNADRGAEFGSIWYAVELLGHPIKPLDPIAAGLFAAACLGIAIFALRAPRTPTLPVLAFLVVAAFLVTNKVYSPQYVLWLVPLAVLAGVSIVEYAVWQAAEVLYWLTVWDYLDTGGTDFYPVATMLRIAATLWLIGSVVASYFTWTFAQVAPSVERAE
jgi:uncharacterized membrane protein